MVSAYNCGSLEANKRFWVGGLGPFAMECGEENGKGAVFGPAGGQVQLATLYTGSGNAERLSLVRPIAVSRVAAVQYTTENSIIISIVLIVATLHRHSTVWPARRNMRAAVRNQNPFGLSVDACLLSKDVYVHT